MLKLSFNMLPVKYEADVAPGVLDCLQRCSVEEAWSKMESKSHYQRGLMLDDFLVLLLQLFV